MPFTVSFENSLEYVMGIGMLRVEANQHQFPNPQQVTLRYHDKSATLTINLAYRPAAPDEIADQWGRMVKNPNKHEGLPFSLYILGLVKDGVNYVFSDQNVQVGTSLNFGCAYNDMGDPGSIGIGDIAAAMGDISSYNGVARGGFKRNLAVLTICISEAIRFYSVQGAIGNVCSGRGVYHTEMGKYTSWGNAKPGAS